MTTKTLTSNYPDGYSLNAKYSNLVIDLGVSVGTSASSVGVYSSHTATIANYGTVTTSSSVDGVFLKNVGGSVINGSASDTTALIAGGAAGVYLYAKGASATISNFGTIHSSASNGSGVGLNDADGSLTNGSAADKTAVISSLDVGVYIYRSAAATVTNYGTIQGATGGGSGVRMANSGGAVTNGSAADTTALIKGTFGVYTYHSTGVTVTNFGTIEGPSNYAVLFHSAADRLIVEKSAVFVGALAGGGGTLELAGGSDTITGLGGAGVMTGSVSASFNGFGSYIVDTGAGLTLTGTNTLAAGQSLTVAGSLTNTGALTLANTGDLLVSGALTNKGSISGGAGVTLMGSGVLTNAAGHVITASAAGDAAVYGYAYSKATVVNFGTVEGTGVTAIQFQHSGDRLVAEAGSTVIGAIHGGGGTLELAGGTGTITGLGATGTLSVGASGTFSGFGTYRIDAGSKWTLPGASAIGVGRTLDNSGAISIKGSDAALTVSGVLVNSGTIDVDGISGADAGLVFSGKATLSGGGVVDLGEFGSLAGYSPASLTNLDNTITGAGAIYGSFSLTNASAGVIDATERMAFNNQGGTVVNDGLVESTGSGDLVVKDTTLADAGGGKVIVGRKLYLTFGAAIEGGSLDVDAGATLISGTGGGTVDLDGATVTNAGIIDGSTGGLTIDGALDNAHIAQAFDGDLTITGPVNGAGVLRMEGTGKLIVDGADAERVEFVAGSKGELVLGDVAGFTGKIQGFSLTGANSIDLADGAWSSADTATFKAGKGDDGALTIAHGTTVLAVLDLTGDYKSSTFTLANDGSGGVLIKDPPKTTALTQAMAGFGGSNASGASTAIIAAAQPPPLASPHSG